MRFCEPVITSISIVMSLNFFVTMKYFSMLMNCAVCVECLIGKQNKQLSLWGYSL